MANMAKDGKSKLYNIFGGAANVAEWEKVCSKFRNSGLNQICRESVIA